MQDKRVLDIGCNVGKVTVEIGNRQQESHCAELTLKPLQPRDLARTALQASTSMATSSRRLKGRVRSL